MEEDSTTELSESDLRDAGASETFIDYCKAAKDMGIETNATRHAERVVESGSFVSGGGFFDALWNAEPRYQHSDDPYGADGTNTKILREAGIYPSEDRMIA